MVLQGGTHEKSCTNDNLVGFSSLCVSFRLYIKCHERFGEDGEVSLAELRQRDRPNRALVSPPWVKGLVPSAVVQIGVSPVLAGFGCTVASKEVVAATAHPAAGPGSGDSPRLPS